MSGIQGWLVGSSHKGPVMRYGSSCHDVIIMFETKMTTNFCTMFLYTPLIPWYTLRSRQNGRQCPDDNFKCSSLNENIQISINISLKFVSKGPVNNIPALVQIMAWRRPGDKPLSETMMVRLPTHICVTRPQWVDQHKLPHYPKRHLQNDFET